MAKVKDPLGCRDVRGSIGGMTYSRGRMGAYVKGKGRVLPKRTHDQQQTRAVVQRITSKYQTLDRVVLEAWAEFGATWPVTGAFGDDGNICGCSWFVKLNFHRIQDGLSWIVDPPPGPMCDYLPSMLYRYGAWGISLETDPRPTGEQLIYVKRFQAQNLSRYRVPEKSQRVGYFSAENLWPVIVRESWELGVGHRRYFFQSRSVDFWGRPGVAQTAFLDVDIP